MNNRSFNSRYIILTALVVLLALTCIVRLFGLQIVNGSRYRNQAEQRLVQAYPIKAPRGEIVDRYNVPFVKNKMGYTVQLQKIDLNNDDLNDVILRLYQLIEKQGGTPETDFPIFYDEVNELWGFTYTDSDESRKKIKDAQNAQKNSSDEIDEDAAAKLKEQQKNELDDWKAENKLEEYDNAYQIMNFYRTKYSVAGKYTDTEALRIAAVRYDMQKSGFSANNPYIMARDIDEGTLQQIKEHEDEYPGVEVEIEPVRVFAEGTTAAHLLGRTGKIYAEEYQELKDKGYGMNDIVGKDGLEKVLEPYLKGKDGYKSVSMSRMGGETEIVQSQPVEPGNYAKLTLDMELQKAAEKALEENVTAAVSSSGAGGAIAIIPNTGEVLALASYPGYDPATFDEDYDKLVKAKSKPLFNRVLNGVYSPGSTFKPLTAIAGLETGVIKPDTYIVDKGKYTYFDSYQPTCLIYSSTGATHGTIEVSEALGVSCNYFFYEVGRLVGIDKLDEYAERFGLGEATGIELGESKGQMASPKHREEAGGIWYPGDVIQAAIGQSDNLFTPAQLANYIATLLNKGRRYRLHLINEIVDYDTDEVVMRKNPEIIADNKISDSTFDKVTDGMRRVVTTGTARSAFATAKYKAAGKTGTAEVSDGADNVLFVGFAPYENPEIVVAVVIEHGASSTYAARVAREIFDKYMELKETRSNPDKAAENNKNTTESAVESENKKSTAVPSAKKTNSSETVKGKTPGTTQSPEESNSESDGTL